MVAMLFSSAAFVMDHRQIGLQTALLSLVTLGWVAYQAYLTSTFDHQAFLASFPVSYAAPVGKPKKGAAPVGGPVDITAFAPVVLVTAGWALLYYAFLFDQSATAFVVLKDAKRKAKMEGKPMPQLSDVKYGRYSKSARVRASDRTVGNYLEQSVPFLVSLWAHAAFVSPVNAPPSGGPDRVPVHLPRAYRRSSPASSSALGRRTRASSISRRDGAVRAANVKASKPRRARHLAGCTITRHLGWPAASRRRERTLAVPMFRQPRHTVHPTTVATGSTRACPHFFAHRSASSRPIATRRSSTPSACAERPSPQLDVIDAGALARPAR